MTLAHATGQARRPGPPDRGRVVVQRNVHSSIIDGLVLSGLRPTFVAPEIDPELGIAHCVTPEALDAALEAEPDAEAAMLVSPTYFGAVARIEDLAEVAHARGVPLVVDEAWGSHLYFHEDLPTGALRGGADLVLSSTHKIVGSLTQSAILHLGDGDRIDEDVIDRSVTLVESTSPNALLTASLDAARRFAGDPRARAARRDARRHWSEPASGSGRSRAWTCSTSGSRDERASRPGTPCASRSTSAGPGATGHRIAELMRERDDVVLELFSENVIVAVFGLGRDRRPRPPSGWSRGFAHAVEEIGPADLEQRRAFAEPPPWGPLDLAPRDAFLGPQEVVPFAGRRGQDRGGVARRLPARRPQRAPRGAADGADDRLHRRLPRPRWPCPRGERPVPANRSGW